ncbi:hypothetical protein RhiirA1_438444 [Rhizophagus irregularis]|uniref:Uncharacterized protein n=1 Tax=Rhizophagus irregularis TaxID=588596 RepID=A0A2N0S9E5_9GLOM|nr:hypothetical protein RhiirA1_438444 [Rhizophagus irregularis]
MPTCSDNDGKEIFIGYMKTPLIREVNKKRHQCYPTVWFDRQLAFAFDFEPGDSGGFLHAAIAAWITEHFSVTDMKIIYFTQCCDGDWDMSLDGTGQDSPGLGQDVVDVQDKNSL